MSDPERQPGTAGSRCPCGSGRGFDECCGPILAGRPAPTPESLMRSRYTAFVRGDLAHIDRTQSPELRAAAERDDGFANEVTWQRLEVLRAAEQGDTGSVEFRAHFRRSGQDFQHHERSAFRRVDGRWLYVGAEFGPGDAPRRVAKIGRNAPCPCGSGKKYKACCGR